MLIVIIMIMINNNNNNNGNNNRNGVRKAAEQGEKFLEDNTRSRAIVGKEKILS